jgi:hypothetical protein
LKELAQQKESEANSALEKLAAETKVRQQAETERRTELERRLQLAEELHQEKESLRKRELELRESMAARTAAEIELHESTVARTTAEAAASEAERDRDQILRESSWLQYTEGLTQADDLLVAGGKAAAREVLQRCPREERGWEWYYLDEIATSLTPNTEVMLNPSFQLESIVVSDDISAFIARTEKLGPLPVFQVFQVAPFALLDDISRTGKSIEQCRIQRSQDDANRIIVAQEVGNGLYLWVLEGVTKRRVRLEKKMGAIRLSADGALLIGAGFEDKDSPFDNTIERCPVIRVASATSGEVLMTVDIELNRRLEFTPELFLGRNSYFALLGSVRENSLTQYLWLFPANSSRSRVMPQLTIPLEDARGLSIRFSARQDQLLIGREAGYQIIDIATGSVVDKFDSDRRTLAVAMSPDNSRVLTMDSEGIVLRERDSSRSLPRLKSLPWGLWGTQLGDRFVINYEWTRCLATGDAIDQHGNTVPAVYAWRCDQPIASSQ